jgi:hypothetical protein
MNCLFNNERAISVETVRGNSIGTIGLFHKRCLERLAEFLERERAIDIRAVAAGDDDERWGIHCSPESHLAGLRIGQSTHRIEIDIAGAARARRWNIPGDQVSNECLGLIFGRM